MKKIALILFASVTLFSCGAPSAEETPAQDSTAVVAVDTVKPVDTVTVTTVDSTSQAK